jgi:predicted metal-binding protein
MEGREDPRKLLPVDQSQGAERLPLDAQRYCALLTALGASQAEIIDPAIIPVDERVRLKCMVPKCSGFGSSANCPPHSMSPAQTGEILALFRCAVVFRVPVPADVIVRNPEKRKDLQAIRRKVYKLVSAVEGAAFYDGHYFATGFASGSCRSALCVDQDCAVLSGQKCRHNLKARPAMEAVGIDCFLLAVRLNWVIYPIGSSARSDEVPEAHLMGLVLLG